MGYINKISIDSTTHLIEPTLYAVTEGTAAAITASITDFVAVAGVVITLKITTSNAVSATLNINNNGAKNIYYNGAPITAGILQAEHIYNFIYLNNNNTYYWALLGDLSIDTQIEIIDMMTTTSS